MFQPVSSLKPIITKLTGLVSPATISWRFHRWTFCYCRHQNAAIYGWFDSGGSSMSLSMLLLLSPKSWLASSGMERFSGLSQSSSLFQQLCRIEEETYLRARCSIDREHEDGLPVSCIVWMVMATFLCCVCVMCTLPRPPVYSGFLKKKTTQ